jgi:hypothetical protein
MCSLYRRNPKRDTNEAIVVEALRRCGFSVIHLSIRGCGDLLLGKDGITRVAEVKGLKEDLNDEQQAWWESWRGNPLMILRSIEDVAYLAKWWSR